MLLSLTYFVLSLLLRKSTDPFKAIPVPFLPSATWLVISPLIIQNPSSLIDISVPQDAQILGSEKSPHSPLTRLLIDTHS